MLFFTPLEFMYHLHSSFNVCFLLLQDREKQDQLNELLNNYSTNGIPHMPEFLTLGRETQSEKEDLFEMEPHWSSIVENASVSLTVRQTQLIRTNSCHI